MWLYIASLNNVEHPSPMGYWSEAAAREAGEKLAADSPEWKLVRVVEVQAVDEWERRQPVWIREGFASLADYGRSRLTADMIREVKRGA